MVPAENEVKLKKTSILKQNKTKCKAQKYPKKKKLNGIKPINRTW